MHPRRLRRLARWRWWCKVGVAHFAPPSPTGLSRFSGEPGLRGNVSLAPETSGRTHIIPLSGEGSGSRKTTFTSPCLLLRAIYFSPQGFAPPPFFVQWFFKQGVRSTPCLKNHVYESSLIFLVHPRRLRRLARCRCWCKVGYAHFAPTSTTSLSCFSGETGLREMSRLRQKNQG